MKWLKLFFAFMLLAGAGVASAGGHGYRHHGARVGVYIGGPLFWPGYAYPAYPPSYYYSAPLVVTPSEPTYYIEKGQEPQESRTASGATDWYYCSDPDGYYPYVRQCRSGWQRIAPQPPAER